jgi:hypothetical protein
MPHALVLSLPFLSSREDLGIATEYKYPYRPTLFLNFLYRSKIHLINFRQLRNKIPIWQDGGGTVYEIIHS